MELIDSHAHLTMPEVLPRLDAILERAQAAHVHNIVNVCTDPSCLKEGLLLEKRCPWIRNAGATSPHDVEQEGELCFETFAAAARSHQLIAIGETGLDYYNAPARRDIQQKFLIRYLHLAIETNLPVIIHCREAFDDLYAITDREYSQCQAVLHCFTGDLNDAKRALDRGWMISLSGIMTFKKSEKLREVVRNVPLDSILIETDTPFLAPQSKRGQPNEPSFIQETAACLAAVKQLSLEEIARVTVRNTKKLFRF